MPDDERDEREETTLLNLDLNFGARMSIFTLVVTEFLFGAYGMTKGNIVLGLIAGLIVSLCVLGLAALLTWTMDGNLDMLRYG